MSAKRASSVAPRATASAPALNDGHHDHGPCANDALDRAERAFEDKGMKLTPLRRLVFEEIAASHDAVGAYDVLDRLARKTGDRMAPVSVYRAIDALLEAGVVHRLESRNAFFACHTPHAGRRHIALVCDGCGTVSEIDGTPVHAAVEVAAKRAGFAIHTSVVEVAGHCKPCRSRSAPRSASSEA
jgi:Fur family transcriptional regulator, zinc uptake regulator